MLAPSTVTDGPETTFSGFLLAATAPGPVPTLDNRGARTAC